MSQRDSHPKILTRIVVVCIALSSGAALVMNEDRTLKIIGGTILALFLVLWFASDFLDALSNERHVKRHPHLLRNEAIGKTVIALGDFDVKGGAVGGFVLLKGEKWRAQAPPEHVPKNGETLNVCGREGLVLHVRPQPLTPAADRH